ncbi:MAG: ribosome biogenesis GTPase Der [Firmicutes bacterium]|jgi:GTP-binding protein|nr:ribosome biogenesis GTPase Der [Bacillota bacterium]MDH7495560.1 ribosome biogenesis GTPase Der [Bacillota bacterium]
MGAPVVAIVGRPNVGKSALFNRIVGTQHAIVEETPGVTRDRICADVEWRGRKFILVDTGGIEPSESGDPIQDMTTAQARVAIEEADLVLFLVDTKSGLIPQDAEIADLLRRSGRPVILVASKAEGARREDYLEFFALGFGCPVPISSVHGTGIGDLLDAVLVHLGESQDRGEDLETEEAVRIAVVGRPNVGKSSLVNAILGTERSIVSAEPGTTRDAVDTPFEWRGRRFVIIDTAGLRRKTRVHSAIERYSALRAERAIRGCDVALVVLDASEGPAAQDVRIAGLADEAGRASVIVLNKWDLVSKEEGARARLERAIDSDLAFLSYAYRVFVSALTGAGIQRLMLAVEKAAAAHARRVATSALNEVIEEAQMRVEPPHDRGRQLKIFYGTQVGTRPPEFSLFVNDPDLVHFSYERYLENRLREAFDFEGTPVRLRFRRRG